MVFIETFRRATELDSLKKRLLETIGRREQMSQSDIVNMFENEVSQPTVWRNLQELETVGVIDIISDGKTKILKINSDGEKALREAKNGKVMILV